MRLPWLIASLGALWIAVAGFWTGLALLRLGSWRGFLAWGAASVLALVPVIGAAMAFTAFTGSRYAKHASLAAGVGILGYGAYKTISTFVATTGWGLWLVIGSALVALFAGLSMKTKER